MKGIHHKSHRGQHNSKKGTDIDVMVVGNDHYNTLNVIRALGKKGLKCGVIIISDTPQSMVLKTRWKEVGDVCHEGNVIQLLIDKYSCPDTLIPLTATDDNSAALIDQHHDTLKKHFVLPSCGGIQGRLAQCMDKDIQLRYAVKAGFTIPKTIALNIDKWDKTVPAGLAYPCIIKPEQSISGSKQDFRICNSEAELQESLCQLARHMTNVLIQEYIPNDEVIVISGVRGFNGETYVFGEINKYKKGNKIHNLGLCCMGRLDPDSELREECVRMVNDIDYHGCFSIDIVRTSDNANGSPKRNYFMEMNLRSDGLIFFYTKAGINYPYIWYQCCRGETPEIHPISKPIFGINEFLYVREQLSLSMMKDFFKADVFSLFDRHDIKPFIYKILYNAKKQIPLTS